MTPAAAVRTACGRIRAKKNPERARFTANYFIAYTPIPLLGLTVPDQRTIARELFKQVKSDWSVEDAFEFADRMVSRRNFEDRAVGIYLLGCYKKQLTSSMLKRIKPWLTDDKLCSWAFVDALCGEVTHPIIAADRRLLRTVRSWARARNMWVRRTSAVSLVRLATRGEELDTAYEVARCPARPCGTPLRSTPP
jgi:3-methyladenine DNA glycosylase AlkD